MSATTTPAQTDQVSAPPPTELAAGSHRRTLLGSTLQSVLAVVVALILGGLLIAVTNEDVREAAGYFFARPGDYRAANQSITIAGAQASYISLPTEKD